MPFALLFIGMVLVVTGFRNTYQQLGQMFVADLTGKSGGAGFIMFFAALFIIGAIGTVPKFRTFSHYFMGLVLLSLLIHNKGFAQRLIAALRGTRAPATTASVTPASTLQKSFAGAPSSGNVFGPIGGFSLGAPSSGVLE